MIKMRNDRGDSLLEVVISTVIMGIIGVLLISSIAVARPFADKMSLIGQTVQDLNSLAESINLQGFIPCTPGNPEPYRLAQISLDAQPTPGFAVTTTSLPPVLAGNPYQAQLHVQNQGSNLAWSVEPQLPTGLTLDPATGVISGKTEEAVTSKYLFTASSDAGAATAYLMLTVVRVNVAQNNSVSTSATPNAVLTPAPSTAWPNCASSTPITNVTSASGKAEVVTYTYNGQQVNAGDVITIWGFNNIAFNGVNLRVATAGNGSFTVATLGQFPKTLPSAIVEVPSSAFANLSINSNIQKVVLSTAVSGSALEKHITKAIQ